MKLVIIVVGLSRKAQRKNEKTAQRLNGSTE